MHTLMHTAHININYGLRFDKILLCAVRFTAHTYCRSKKKCDSGIYLQDGVKCIIESFIQIGQGAQSRIVVFAKQMVESNEALDSIWHETGTHTENSQCC